uniref:Uncharacterized protein n=1 Tax=Musa acuminata subsp. malaccensis TaxID=214687 RepID=A0A804I187_MUSAM
MMMIMDPDSWVFMLHSDVLFLLVLLLPHKLD